jgi:HEAT repeat protein
MGNAPANLPPILPIGTAVVTRVEVKGAGGNVTCSAGAVLMVSLVLLVTGVSMGQSLVLVRDRGDGNSAEPNEIRAAAQTDLQDQIAEVLVTKRWPQSLESLKELLKDVPAKDQVEALLPFIAFHQPDNWIPQCNAAVTYQLGELGAQAVPALRKLLEHKDARQREAAASALAHMAHRAQSKDSKPGAEAVEKLGELLVKDEAVGVRREAARALYSYGRASIAAIDQISAAIRDNDEMVRGMVQEALGMIGMADDATILAVVAELKRSGRDEMEPLQKMGPAARAALPMLLEIQQDGNRAAEAERAIAWIWEIGGPGAEYLELMLKALPSGSACTAAKKMAGFKLPDRARDAARDGLLAGLDHVSYWSGEAYVKAIGEMFKGDKAVAAALEPRMGSDRTAQTRLYAAAALFRVTGDEKRAVEVLAEVLGAEAGDPPEGPRKGEIRGAAATMLAEFGPRGRAALPQLRRRWEQEVNCTDQGHAYVRAKLAPALWKITGRACEPVDALLKDVAGKDGAYAEQTGEALLSMAPLLVDRVTDIAPGLNAEGDWHDDKRWWAARLVSAVGPCEQARKALPALERLMREDGSEYTRRVAAAAVWAVTRDPNRVVPALVQLTRTRDRNVYYVLPLLASMGPAAREALPALRQLAELKGWSSLSADAKATIAAIERAPSRPDEAAYTAWWTDLAGDDADKSVSAVWAFALAGEEGIAFLAKQPGYAEDKPETEAGRVGQLVKDLDDNQFRVREQASEKLMAMLPDVVPDLREALKTTTSKEVETRLEALLRAAPDHGLRLVADATAADIRRAFRVRQLRELAAGRARAPLPRTDGR